MKKTSVVIDGVPVEWEGVGIGHTIVNSSGTEMATRTKMKFLNSNVTDDPTNNQTIIDPGSPFSTDASGYINFNY